jgi:NAD(P)-dependent dehydrogenase (short-subunit alcohol dehydrogenase family)
VGPYSNFSQGCCRYPKIVSDEQRQRTAKNIPVGRMGQPEDIGRTVVSLASDAASYITGATLPVSGGADLKVG